MVHQNRRKPLRTVLNRDQRELESSRSWNAVHVSLSPLTSKRSLPRNTLLTSRRKPRKAPNGDWNVHAHPWPPFESAQKSLPKRERTNPDSWPWVKIPYPPIPTKIGSKMGGEFTSKWDPKTVLTTTARSLRNTEKNGPVMGTLA